MHRIFPDDLKTGKVVPIFKGDERHECGKYGPITTLYSLARIFEKIICGQLFDCFDSNNLLFDKQWGFRWKLSTIYALQKSTNSWLLNMDNGHSNAVIFLDLRKAFDTVDHNIMLKKLASYGMPDDELQFFKSYLTHSTQYCSANGKMSSFANVTCGVPQGSILGLLLFIIYVNDRPSVAFN